MGYLRRLDNNADIQAFPGANFEAAGDVPAAQCTEAQIEGDAAETHSFPHTLIDIGAFASFDLAGKVCHITASVGGNTGDFDILTLTGQGQLNLLQDPGTGDPVTYYVTDAGEFELTRNVASLAAFIHAAGYAYTFKAGKLYTNMPSGQLKDACTILFDPIT